MNKQNTKLIFLLIIIGSLSNFAYSNDLQNEINSNDNMSEKVLQNTLANNPNSKTAKLLCAKIYIKNKKYNDAEKLIRQVLDEDPNNIKAQKLINEINHHSHNKDYKDESVIKEKKELTTITTKPESITKETTQNNSDNKIKKLPSKSEILKRAKENNKKTDEPLAINPVPVKEDIISKTINNQSNITQVSNKTNNSIPNISKVENNDNDDINENHKLETLEPIVLRVKKQPNNNITIINLDENKVNIPPEDDSEKMVFKPYISKEFTNSKKYEKAEYSLKNSKPKVSSEKSNNFTRNSDLLNNTNKSSFIEDTSDSFYINLEEAYSKIEKNDLISANKILNNAYTIAVNQKSNKKLLDVQLTRAVLYIYNCDFNSYGKHILSIRKGLSEETYKSLEKIYETAISIKDKNLLYKYVANIAYDSGHYLTALELSNKIQPADKESNEIKNKASSALSQINGEILLNNGSYLRALDYFEKENDESEKGRTYLAISKSLYESNEPKNAKIAEHYGFSSLVNYIQNDPNNPKANLYLALYLLDKGDKDQAKEAIRRGLNSQGTNELVTSKLLNLAEKL